MMAEHAKSGMAFAGKVSQLITVGLGLEDWEWGVTLWAANPEFLKDIVYRMRFDEASARYAEFGPFYAGLRGDGRGDARPLLRWDKWQGLGGRDWNRRARKVVGPHVPNCRCQSCRTEDIAFAIATFIAGLRRFFSTAGWLIRIAC